MLPEVSVVIPTFNRCGFVSQAINSVLDQSYSSQEVIVVDDGSTDDTFNTVAAFGERVRYIYQDHQGMGGSYSRNRGISESKGSLIAFLDSDDIWKPGKLLAQVRWLKENPSFSWVYCDSAAYDEELERLIYRHSTLHGAPTGNVLEELFTSNFIHTSSVLVKREVFSEVGDFWPTPKATDRDMWLRIASAYPLGYVPEVLVQYRIHQDRVTDRLNGDESLQADLTILNRAMERDPELLSPYWKRAKAELYVKTGMLLTKQGELRRARSFFRDAISVQPTRASIYLYFASTFLSEGMLGNLKTIRRRILRNFGSFGF